MIKTVLFNFHEDVFAGFLRGLDLDTDLMLINAVGKQVCTKKAINLKYP